MMASNSRQTVVILLSLIFALSLSYNLRAANVPDTFSQIRIFVPDKSALTEIWNSGIDFEGSTGKIGGWMEFVAGQAELKQLSKKNILYEIIVDDLSKKYEKDIAEDKTPFSVFGFGYGSMGGYYTYSEVNQQLDTMIFLYPSLITAKDSIGVSIEGRTIWAVKISINPDVNNPSKPEILYTALHHAREPMGLMTVMYYMWWLLENYGTDPDATYLVNNRQIWFIPIVNPDGYVYNQTTNPTGGGMWRKNRRDNGGGNYGVDPNRNYGPYYMWNANNSGSSIDPASDTYRGTAPFSETENQAMDSFMRSRTIATCLNYHTYGNLLIYPWGYLSRESPDSLTFREFAFDMVGVNRYSSGTDLQTVHYSTRGNSDDYMYGDTTKQRTFTMTPEVGSGTSFWPAKAQILPLASENLQPNKYFSYVAGQYTTLKNYAVKDSSGNEFVNRSKTFSITMTVRNKGLANASNLMMNITANSPYIRWIQSSVTLPLVPARSDAQATFWGHAASNATTGKPIQAILTITDTSGYVHNDTVTITFGTPTALLTDSASNGTTNWSTGTGWNISSSAHSPPASFSDSPVGNYSSNADNSLSLLAPINLTGYDYAVLKFWTRWAVEASYDFATVEASTNGGTTWITLRTQLSRKGSGLNSTQVTSRWGFDGFTPAFDWVEQEVNLTQFLNKQIKLQFRLRSDAYTEYDGWNVDDIRVYAYNESPYQFDFSASLTISDNGAANDSLIFGEDSHTTSGLDLDFGETELAAKPPKGTFDIRWSIPLTFGAKTNLMKTLAQPDSQNIFVAEVQPGSGGYPMMFSWNPDIFSVAEWTLRDGKTHGKLFSFNMTSSSGFTLNDTSVNTVEIVHVLDSTAVGVISDNNFHSPREFALHQNYPNPFNPTTIIHYQLPTKSYVILKIYDVLGQEMRTLVNEVQDAGYKSVEWKPEYLPSGIYFYRLTAGNFLQVRKMVLMK